MKTRVPILKLLLAVVLMGGCASSNSSPSFPPLSQTASTTGRVVIRDDGQPTTPSGEVADSVELEMFDAGGQLVYGPVVVPLAPEMVFDNIPRTAQVARIEVDYLRNGGFLLLRANITPSTGQVVFSDPNEQAVEPNTTRWQFTQTANGFQIVPSVSGAPVAISRRGVRGRTDVPFKIRGVCYSPAAIGASNKFGSLGDYFWDGGRLIDTGKPQKEALLDWEQVWRRDLENIRPNFNCIRLYSMIAMQQNGDGSLPDPSGYQDFTHKKFLDACWNNGNNPIYVLVGIPMPASCYIPGFSDAERVWWETNLDRSVKQVKDHPAVIGFTIFNELGGASEYGGPNSQFYWSQIQKYSGQVKQLAPDKVVGYAWFDGPDLVKQAAAQNLPQQYGNHLDFFGVNAFQSKVIDPSLAPYKDLGKPVIFTEFGLCGTTHSDPSTSDGSNPTQAGSLSITETPQTRQKAADALKFILPVCLQHESVAGLFYFEWSDEWWKQDSGPGFTTQDTRWDGGKKVGEPFPNDFNDEEGFGLHSIATNGRSASAPFSPFDPNAAAGNNKPDVLTRRSELWDAVRGAFGAVR